MDSVAGDLYITILNQLQWYTVEVIFTLTDAVGEIAWWVVYFYFLFAFFGMMTGRLKEPKEMAISAILVTILYSAIGNGEFYYTYICRPFVELAENTSATLIQSTSGGSARNIEQLFTQLDSIFGTAALAINDLTPEGGWLKDTIHVIKVVGGLGILGLCYLVVYIAFLVILSLSMFSMHMLFMVGPIFVFFAAFSKTRGLTWGWIKAEFTFVLTIIFTCLAVSICLENLQETVASFALTKSTDSVFNKTYFNSLCWTLLSFAMLLKAPDLAASLTGGSAGSTSGITAGVSMVGSAATGGVFALGKAGAAGGVAGAGRGLSSAGKGMGAVGSTLKQWWGHGDKPSR